MKWEMETIVTVCFLVAVFVIFSVSIINVQLVLALRNLDKVAEYLNEDHQKIELLFNKVAKNYNRIKELEK